MKNLFLVLFVSLFLSLSGCKVESTTTTTAEPTTQTDPVDPDPPTDPDPPETPDPPIDPPTEPDPVATPFELVSIGTGNVMFYDGTDWTMTAYEKRAAPSTYMELDTINQLDTMGSGISQLYAPEQGDLVKKTASGYTLCDVMTPAEALALGGMFKEYSQVHKYNGATWSESNHWSVNQWACSEIFETASGQHIIKDTANGIHSDGPETAIFTAEENGLLIHNYDGIARNATFTSATGSTAETWATNYLTRAKNWILANGTYYSANGYEYSAGTGLVEAANIMHEWNLIPYPVTLPNGEAPVMIPLGYDAGLNAIYWIECNSGWIVEHRLATNSMSMTKRLYIGDGMRATGWALSATLKPLVNAGLVYYNYQGTVIKLDLATGASSIFLADDVSLEVF